MSRIVRWLGAERDLARLLACAAVLVLAACGGSEAPGSAKAMPSMAAAVIDPAQCTAAGLAAGEVQSVRGQCLRSTRALGLTARSGPAQGMAPPLSAAEAMDWAEAHYPELFPAEGKVSGYLEPYTYRYYARTNNYLGVSIGSNDVAVYLYGAVADWQIRRVAALQDFTCTIKPGSCVLSVAPALLTFQVAEGSAQEALLVLTLPAPTPGTWQTLVDPQVPAGWLSASAVSSDTVLVKVTATSLKPSTLASAIVVHHLAADGTRRSVRVPVTLTVTAAQEFIAPASQVHTLDVDHTSDAVRGSLLVSRSGGMQAAWSATSSEPWLVLSTASGTTPSNLEYRLDLARVAALANLRDHSAVVTLTAAGAAPASFRVTLRKRLPYPVAVLPYGVPAGSPMRVVIGGSGFNQYADVAAALKVAGVALSQVRRVSDRQITFMAQAPAPGAYPIELAGSQSPDGAPQRLLVSAADPYVASAAVHTGDQRMTSYLHDPVRQAVYALSYKGNALYKYQYRAGQWTVSAKALANPLRMALTPDGKRLFVCADRGAPFTDGLLQVIDPDTLAITATIALPFPPNGTLAGELPVSVDGRIWIPKALGDLAPAYFDLADGTLQSMSLPGSVSVGLAYAPADGTVVAFEVWYRYDPATASWIQPTQTFDFWLRPSLNIDGSIMLGTNDANAYDASYQLIGQLPNRPDINEYWAIKAISPDGKRIVAGYLDADNKVPSLEIFSTSEFLPGTTRFQRLASLPVTQQSTRCHRLYAEADGCPPGGQLLAAIDGRTIFWGGNLLLQVFKLP